MACDKKDCADCQPVTFTAAAKADPIPDGRRWSDGRRWTANATCVHVLAPLADGKLLFCARCGDTLTIA